MAQADLVVRHYRETTMVAERTDTEIWDVMTKAQERTIKSIRARIFEKYILVAHPDNGEDFFYEVFLLHFHVFLDMNNPFILYPRELISFFLCAQIDRHFNEFASIDMTIKKSQEIVTCPVKTSLKAKWLHWWNASIRERSKNKFPINKLKRENALDDWLHKASFWAQIYPFLGLLKFFLFLLFYI